MEGASIPPQDEPEPDPQPRLDPVAGGRGSEGDTPEELPSTQANLAMKKEKGRVRFNSNAALTQPPKPESPGSGVPGSPGEPPHRDVHLTKPRPSVLRANSANSVLTIEEARNVPEPDPEKAISAAAAQERAKHVADKVRRDSPTHSHDSRPSLDSHADTVTSNGDSVAPSHDRSIPLQTLWRGLRQGDGGQPQPDKDEGEREQFAKDEAWNLVRAHTVRRGSKTPPPQGADDAQGQAQKSSQAAPVEVNDGQYDGVYNVPAPQQYRGSVLSQLLKLYKPGDTSAHGLGPAYHNRNASTSSAGGWNTGSGSESGTTTPGRKKWYEQNRSQETLSTLIGASARLANPNMSAGEHKPPSTPKRWPIHRRTSSNRLSTPQNREELRITVHIAETLSRQEFIVKLCRALMLYGAPTHRLEEYLTMVARVLEIDGQFLYLPGCMVISFDDKSTHTTEVKIVRITQGIDLGKLKDVHLIYKEVMHDVIGVEEGTERIDNLLGAKDKYSPWFRVLIFGLTSATAAPFSFKARLIDLPLTFLLGCLVGTLQLIVAAESPLYSNVFEVSATVLVSFLARAFGSINGGELFCFSALAQGGIVMLLPGYAVLCSALELQSRALVPGSIRIVYAVIYSLLLGFGITVGSALYGLFDSNPTSDTECHDPLSGYHGFIFVPFFVICISILYQAKWRQMPVMVVIAFAGYVVNYFSSIRFVASPQIASALGALCVGVLANLYSRLRHGVAAATLIPAIFTQVPGGLASTGGLLSGLSVANQLTNSTDAVNGTSTVPYGDSDRYETVIFDVAAKMVQIATGIAVGLFISALIIYPLGKRRSGLFSF